MANLFLQRNRHEQMQHKQIEPAYISWPCSPNHASFELRPIPSLAIRIRDEYYGPRGLPALQICMGPCSFRQRIGVVYANAQHPVSNIGKHLARRLQQLIAGSSVMHQARPSQEQRLGSQVAHWNRIRFAWGLPKWHQEAAGRQALYGNLHHTASHFGICHGA